MTTVVQDRESTSGFAIAGLIFSVLGWFTCGLMSIPGAFLCFLALFARGPKGAAIAGLIVGFPGTLFFAFSGAALIAGFLGLGAATRSAIIDTQHVEVSRPIQSAPVESGERMTPGPTAPDQQGPDEKPEDTASHAPDVVRSGDLEVRLVEAKVDHVPLMSIGNRATSSEDRLLAIVLEITNHSSTKIARHEGWGAREADFSRSKRARLRDNFGNSYTRCRFGFGTDVVGQVSRFESIYPGKSISDVVVFEPPLDGCEFVVLELPLDSDTLEITIPAATWKSATDATDASLLSPSPVAEGFSSSDEGHAASPASIATQEEKLLDESTEARIPNISTERDEASASTEDARWRTWTSADGQFTVEAKFRTMIGAVVSLERRDGVVIQVPRERLSEEDVDWITNRRWIRP